LSTREPLLPSADSGVRDFPRLQAAGRGGNRIDWILVREGTQVRTAAINTRTVDGQWASDHSPVQAQIELA
jgi:endonuclease/exonuclease/phosphatase family metal-dependent hydrolase